MWYEALNRTKPTYFLFLHFGQKRGSSNIFISNTTIKRFAEMKQNLEQVELFLDVFVRVNFNTGGHKLGWVLIHPLTFDWIFLKAKILLV